MKIRHLTHPSIDKIQWDHTINNASNGLLMAQSWCLDIVSPQWEALVSENYEYVFPIPVKRKYKVPYLVQPVFTQQLGLFSALNITKEMVLQFVKKLSLYSYELHLNEKNCLPHWEQLPNYVLELNAEFGTLKAQFSKNTQRNIDKAIQFNLNIIDLSVQQFTSFYAESKNQYQSSNVTMLNEWLHQGALHRQIIPIGVVDSQNELIAALAYGFYKNRITLLVPVSNDIGKQKSAMFFMVYQLIKQHAHSSVLLDFEGSSNEGVARFYKGFGAQNRPYNKIKNLRPSFLIGRI